MYDPKLMLSLYSLLPAAKIVAGESEIWGYHVGMAAIAVLLFGGGIWYFGRKDFYI